MGKSYTYTCPNCGYSVLTSAGHDRGMLAETDTYICTSCKEIVDVCVGVFGQTFSKEEVKTGNLESKHELGFYRCPLCNSGEHLVLWDTLKKPCPKCDEKMRKAEGGEVILWD